MPRVVHHPAERSLGPSVVAVGAFDGVHIGHQRLLATAVADARHAGVPALAVTFDRDPDEVVHPSAASPRLLSYNERIERILETGVDTVVVVPFTPETAALDPEEFLDDVVSACCAPIAIHVGEGFRFGSAGKGDLDTLYVWGVEHNVHVKPHPLVVVDGATVSSTRIRSLISEGDVHAAAVLLGAAHRVSGNVHRGRGHGEELGFATANVTPDPGLALPADGVYAGRAILENGTIWPSAISVGTPPSFPDAEDFLEAHLIGFASDLYDTRLTLEFLERIRPLRAFEDNAALTVAIAADVATITAIVEQPAYTVTLPESDLDYIEDPAALEAATAAVATISREPAYTDYDESWVAVFGPHRMSTLFSDGGVGAALVTGPLTAAEIPFVWDPFPPDASQSVRPDFNWLRQFTLLVPQNRADEARALLPPGTAND